VRRSPAPKVAKARARKAQAHLVGADPEVITQLARDLRYAKTEDFILKVVAESPPFTDTQLEELAGLLLPVPRGASAA